MQTSEVCGIRERGSGSPKSWPMQPAESDPPHIPTAEVTCEGLSSANRRRAPWRRRLVEAERGLTQGFRGDSTLVVHLFAGCLAIAAGLVLGLSIERWAILAVSFTIVLAAELFNKLARTVCRHAAAGQDALRQAASIGTAAVFVSMLGALIVMALLLGGRLVEVLARHGGVAGAG